MIFQGYWGGTDRSRQELAAAGGGWGADPDPWGEAPGPDHGAQVTKRLWIRVFMELDPGSVFSNVNYENLREKEKSECEY